jgi:hypothetical protein
MTLPPELAAREVDEPVVRCVAPDAGLEAAGMAAPGGDAAAPAQA